jgi:fluoride exporter
LERFLWICLAGALGTGTRYLVGVWAIERFGAQFPYGTLIVNVAGCFLMAFVMQLSLSIASFSPNLRFALTTGFMGGLTTYSSFNYDTSRLLGSGARNAAVANLLFTLTLCLAAGWVGLVLARRLVGN